MQILIDGRNNSLAQISHSRSILHGDAAKPDG